MKLSKTNMRNPIKVLDCPIAAAATVVDDFNISEVARVLGKKPKTLADKLNNDNDFHKLQLEEAVQVTNVIDDHRIPLAWVHGLGYMTLPALKAEHSDEELSDQLLDMQSRIGGFCAAIHKAREKGVITPTDYAEIKRQANAAATSILQINIEIEQMVRHLEEVA